MILNQLQLLRVHCLRDEFILCAEFLHFSCVFGCKSHLLFIHIKEDNRGSNEINADNPLARSMHGFK